MCSIFLSCLSVQNICHWYILYVLSVTVGEREWSRRHWSSTENIHWRQVASSLITGQWRSRVGRWLRQSSHSTAEQWTTTTTRPDWYKLSNQAVVANTIMLRWTHVTTVRYTLQRQWSAIYTVLRHLIVPAAMITDCDSSLLTTLTTSLTWTLLTQ